MHTWLAGFYLNVRVVVYVRLENLRHAKKGVLCDALVVKRNASSCCYLSIIAFNPRITTGGHCEIFLKDPHRVHDSTTMGERRATLHPAGRATELPPPCCLGFRCFLCSLPAAGDATVNSLKLCTRTSAPPPNPSPFHQTG